ncbi:Trafficking protein particle complex subunit 31 [Didymella sp. IMI 355093]|nr:Trafficking protein particle complex subunit 31 [Didymella sp. IMI 355093]
MGEVNLSQDDVAGGPVIDSGLPFDMQVDTYAEDTIKSLLRERGLLKDEVAQQRKDYEGLEQRVCKRAAVDVDLPAEVARRVKSLENEVERYRTKNKDLRAGLKYAQSEVIDLQDEVAGQKDKLKGASKNVRNAMDVTGKEEERAKSAVHDKQL